jgi:hypothetical protein
VEAMHGALCGWLAQLQHEQTSPATARG